MLKKVLVFRDYYLPGFKSGGPIRSLANLVEMLGDEYDFRIVTADRDEGDVEAYDSVEVGAWNSVGKAQVYYVPAEQNPISVISKLLKQEKYDLIYLNSFFSSRYTILPLLLRLLRLSKDARVVVAPRGELSPLALGIKSTKKSAFIALARAVGLYSKAIWQATDKAEAAQIRRIMGDDVEVVVAGIAMPQLESTELPKSRVRKKAGKLEIGFLGRISPIKQVDFALQVVSQVRNGEVRFHIHGPEEEPGYVRRCKRLLEKLPDNVEVIFHGSLKNAKVHETLSQYDLMFMPSKSESFGHAIFESLKAACPVLIGENTPWRDLEEKKAGWNHSFGRMDKFVEVLRSAVEMDAAEFESWHAGALNVAVEYVKSNGAEQAYHRLFK